MQSSHFSTQAWALPLTAALALALLCSAGCRDLKPDPGYCATCAVDGPEIVPGLSEQTDPATGVSAGTGSAAQTPASNQVSTAAGTSAAMSSAGTTATARPDAGIAAAVSGSGAAGRTAIAGTTQAGRSAAASGAGAGASASAGAGTTASMSSGGQGGSTAGSEPNPPERDAGVDAGSVMTLPCGRECNGDRPVCDEARHSCVECTPNDARACTGDRPVCDRGTSTCVGCLSDDSCSGATPVCDTRQQRCITCMRSRPDSCPTGLPVCDEGKQQCVECMPDQLQACKGTRRMCSDKHQCVECLMANDCTTRELPVCSNQQSCVGCQGHEDCRTRFQNTPVCDLVSRACVECLSDSDCANKANKKCNTSRHVCEMAPPPTPTGTKQACEVCGGDGECAGTANAPAVCGQRGNGMFCFASTQAGPCPGGYAPQSVNGKQGSYCVPINDLSCEAVKAAGKSCPQNQCGAGGQCEDEKCTVHCRDRTDCPNNANCDNGKSLCRY